MKLITKSLVLTILLSNCVYAECPTGYEDMGVNNVKGQSQIKIDWIGQKAVTKEGVVGASASLCFAEDGKACKGEDLSIVLNTGSETETIPVDGETTKKYSICMSNCYRSKEEQPKSNSNPEWKKVDSCLPEFKVLAVAN